MMGAEKGLQNIMNFRSPYSYHHVRNQNGEPTSLMEELQVAVAEQELEESALPESFLLASNKADATSILLRQGLFFRFEDSFLSKVYSSVLKFLPRRGFVQI